MSAKELYSPNNKQDLWRNRKPANRSSGKSSYAANSVAARQKTDPAKVPDHPITRHHRAHEIAHHYDCLLKTDEQIGQLLAELEKDGLTESTLFRFSMRLQTPPPQTIPVRRRHPHADDVAAPASSPVRCAPIW